MPLSHYPDPSLLPGRHDKAATGRLPAAQWSCPAWPGANPTFRNSIQAGAASGTRSTRSLLCARCHCLYLPLRLPLAAATPSCLILQPPEPGFQLHPPPSILRPPSSGLQHSPRLPRLCESVTTTRSTCIPHQPTDQRSPRVPSTTAVPQKHSHSHSPESSTTILRRDPQRQASATTRTHSQQLARCSCLFHRAPCFWAPFPMPPSAGPLAEPRLAALSKPEIPTTPRPTYPLSTMAAPADSRVTGSSPRLSTPALPPRLGLAWETGVWQTISVLLRSYAPRFALSELPGH